MARILYISHISELGGPPHSLLKLVKYVKRQHEVAVVAPGDGALFEELEQMGVPSYRAWPYGLTRRCIPWLCQLIFREKFDLIYGNNFSSGPRNALIAAKLTGRPFVWHIREILREDINWRTSLFLRYADVIIAVSEASAQSLKYHAPTKNIQVVYNGIEFDEFQSDIAEPRQYVRNCLGIPPEDLVIVNAGIVCTRKGQAYAVEVATEILRDYPNVTFAFLGRLDTEPEYVQTLKAEAKKLKLHDKIQFLGFHNDIPHFLLGSEILLHTATWDPHPRVVLEGMGAGLPVVAFAVDGLKEQVVNGETGYLVPFGDVSAMVKGLKKCLDNPALRRNLGKMGRERVQTMFTAEETARKVGELVHNLLERTVER